MDTLVTYKDFKKVLGEKKGKNLSTLLRHKNIKKELRQIVDKNIKQTCKKGTKLIDKPTFYNYYHAEDIIEILTKPENKRSYNSYKELIPYLKGKLRKLCIYCNKPLKKGRCDNPYCETNSDPNLHKKNKAEFKLHEIMYDDCEQD